MDLTDKVAIITGGAGGIGRAFAKRLLGRGAKVCICDINLEHCKEVGEELKKDYGQNVLPLYVDVTSSDSLQDVFNKTKEAFGVVDIMINNAATHNEQSFTKTIETNLFSVYRGTEMALAEIAKAGRKSGTIVNISSVVGVAPSPTAPYYSSSKAAILHYSRCMGHDFHYSETGVRVMCLVPENVDTPLIKLAEEYPRSEKTLATFKKVHAVLFRMDPILIGDALLQMLDEGKSGDVAVKATNRDLFYIPPSTDVPDPQDME